MYEITFLRHGESVGVERNILQGHLDLPLTEKGKAQVRGLARYWQKQNQHFHQILTSPLQRARETAEIVSNQLNMPYSVEPQWIERNFGACEGADNGTADHWYDDRPRPDVYQPIFETGEPTWALHMRAGQALDHLLQLPPGSYLVVAHGSILSAALHMVFGVLPYGRSMPVQFRLDPGCFARLTYHPGNARWSLVSFNDHAFMCAD
jgi:broad specificity phosphatase PhoE